MKTLFASIAVLALTAPITLAQGLFPEQPDTGETGKGAVVPEISAMEGAAAIAAVLAIVALVWERRRRAA